MHVAMATPASCLITESHHPLPPPHFLLPFFVPPLSSSHVLPLPVFSFSLCLALSLQHLFILSSSSFLFSISPFFYSRVQIIKEVTRQNPSLLICTLFAVIKITMVHHECRGVFLACRKLNSLQFYDKNVTR